MSIQVPVRQVGLEASIQAAAQRAGRNLNLDLGVSSRSISSLSQPLGKITGQADQFTKSMEASNARVIAFGASVGVLAAVSKGFKSIVSSAIEVEKSLASINTILGANAAQLNQFKNDIFSVARETGNSFETVSEAALELSRQGLKADEVLRRLKDSMILSRLSGLSAAASVEGLTAAVNSFSKEGLTTSEVLNKISKTAASFAVSERDLIEGFKRSASVAQQAGVSINELGGIITAVQQKTARGGAVIGNSFKTIFTRIQRQSSLQLLQDIGADITDAEGKLLTGTQLLGNLAEKLDSLNEIQLASVTEKIGGGFQIAPLIAALDDLNSKTSIFKSATEAMADASGEAYARNAALNQTMAAAINEATVNLKELANTLGEIGVTDSLKNILSFFNSFATSVKDVLQGEGLGSDMAKGIVKGIGAVLSGPGLLIFGAIITKLTINFAQFGIQALKTFFNIGAAAKEIGSIQTTIASTLLNNRNIQTQILALEGNRVAQAQFFSTALNTQLATMERMRSIAASIAPAVYSATTGSRRPRAAEGYMPTVMAEADDIKKGVGGARSSDRPVVIPNFAFGKGKTGTMVAHTGEYIVPNFASGGSAIFNRDMVKTMGLPEGARKIGAAGGFIPNFVSSIKDATTEKQFDALYSQPRYAKNAATDAAAFRGTARGRAAARAAAAAGTKESAKRSSTLQLNADNFGGLGLVSVSGATAGSAVAKAKLSDTEKQEIDRIAGTKTNFEFGQLTNVQTRSLGVLSNQVDNQKAFRQKTKDLFVGPLLQLAESLMHGVFQNNDLQDRASKIKAARGSDPYIFSDSVLGGIFESAVALSTKAVGKITAFDEANQSTPFDFEEVGGASAAFKKAFGFSSNLYKAEAKKTQRSDSLGSIVGKTIRDQDAKLKAGIRNAIIQPKAAAGYIPNFADPLKDAVIREMSAGIPASQIYIDQNSSLKGPMNPSGLMVANRRDEPAGGFQGIARARKEGADARMYGAAGGFVPNYAATPAMPTVGSLSSEQIALKSGVGANLDKALKDFAKQLETGAITIEQVVSELGQMGKNATRVTASAQALATKYAEEIAVRNQTIATQVLESNANKKLAAQLDKIYLEYNKSQKTAQDLANAQAKAAAFLDTTSLEAPDKSAIVSSTASLADSRQSAQPIQRAQKDYLGAMIGAQMALSFLSGAFSDATDGAGLFAKRLADAGQTISTAVFAFEGIKKIGGEGTKLAGIMGKVGVAGQLAATAFGLFSLGKNLWRDYSGATAKAAEQTARFGDIIKEAGVSLSSLTLLQQVRARKLAKDAIYNIQGKVGGVGSKELQEGVAEYMTRTGLKEEDLKKVLTRAGAASLDLSRGTYNPYTGKTLNAPLVIDEDKAFKAINDYLESSVGKTVAADHLKQTTKESTEKSLQTEIQKSNEKTLLEILKKRLEAAIELRKVMLEMPSIQERMLNIDKGLNSTLESRKISIQNTLEANKRIRDLVAEQSKLVSGKLSEKSFEGLVFATVDPTGKIDPEEFAKVETIISNTIQKIEKQKGLNEDILDTLGDQLLKIKGINGDHALREESIEKIIDSLRVEGDILKDQFDLKNKMADLAQKELSIVQARNFVEDQTRKNSLATLANTNKDIDAESRLAKAKFESRKLSIERGAIGAGNEAKRGASAQILRLEQQAIRDELKRSSTKILNDLQSKLLEKAFEVKIDTAEFQKEFDKLKVNVLADGEISEEEINQLNKAVNDFSRKISEATIEEQKAILEANFAEKKAAIDINIGKLTAADQFNKKIVESAEQFKGIINEDIFNLDPAKNTMPPPAMAPKSDSAFDALFAHQELQAAIRAFPPLSPLQNETFDLDLTEQRQQLIEAAKKLKEDLAALSTNLPVVDLQLNDLRAHAAEAKNALQGVSNSLAQLGADASTFSNLVANVFKNLREEASQISFSMLTATSADALTTSGMDRIKNLRLQSGPATDDTVKIAANEIELLSKKLDYETAIDSSTKSRLKFEYDQTVKILQLKEKLLKASSEEEVSDVLKQIKETSSTREGVGSRMMAIFSPTQEEQKRNFEDSLILSSERFRDNMIDGIAMAIEQGGKLKDVLQSAALDFAREMTKTNLRNLMGTVTGGVGSVASSIGQTLFRADGGPITGGSGNKDDVPAMLMSGEYVINKKSVSKYGTAFMEALNNGSVSGYAKGGSVIRDRGLGSDVIGNDAARQTGQGGFQTPGYFGSGAITGKENLLAFAGQAYTSGEGDIIRGGDNFASIDLTPESIRLTNFGRRQGPMAAAVRESKQQAFGLYVQQIEEERRVAEEEKARKKEFRRALLTAAITAVATPIIGGIAKAGASGFTAGLSSVGKDAGFLASMGAGFKGIFSGGDIGGGIMGGGFKNLLTGNFGLSQVSDMKGFQSYLESNPKAAMQFLGGETSRSVAGADGKLINFNLKDPNAAASVSIGGDVGSKLGQSGSLFNKIRGGFSNLRSLFSGVRGSAYQSDFSGPDEMDVNKMGSPIIHLPMDGVDNNVPTVFDYLSETKAIPFATGGRIPQTSGIDTVPAMLSGGEFIMNAGATQRIGANNLNALNSGASTTMDSSENNEELIRKLDELIQITKESSKPVTVNVSSQQSQSRDNESSDSQQKDQNLSRKIKEAVVRVLQEEKRLGGVLRRA